MPVHANRPGPSDHGATKSVSTPAGYAGNARYPHTPLRDWASQSYSASNGRAASSLAGQDNRGSPSTTHAENISAQIPDAPGQGGAPSFRQRTASYVQGR